MKILSLERLAICQSVSPSPPHTHNKVFLDINAQHTSIVWALYFICLHTKQKWRVLTQVSITLWDDSVMVRGGSVSAMLRDDGVMVWNDSVSVRLRDESVRVMVGNDCVMLRDDSVSVMLGNDSVSVARTKSILGVFPAMFFWWHAMLLCLCQNWQLHLTFLISQIFEQSL